MKNILVLVVFFSLFFLFPFNSISQDNGVLPNDTRWVRKSLEYKAICEQTYMNAWLSIRNKLKIMKNPVIIMDLDETVLDNSQYQVELFEKSKTFTLSTWNKFVRKEISTLVPGVKEFILRYKENPDAIIIYISNRDHSTLKATKNNMKKLDIFFENDIFLLKKDEDDTKVIRRKEVFLGNGRMISYGPQKILAYFGDAIGDFPNDKNYQFSINKFIFPNPMYGKW